MRMFRRSITGTTAVLAAATVALAGCSNNGGQQGDGAGKPTVVASTDVYGAIAQAVAGERATVKSLFSNPTGDPHEFEPSAQDTLAVKRASVVVLNGGGYDAYIEKALADTQASVVDAFTVKFGKPQAEGVNEHIFYDLPAVKKVAAAIADALAAKDAAGAEQYRKAATEFGRGLDAVIGRAEAIKTADPGAKIAATEPVSGYLLELAGLTDSTPAAFSHAVEEGEAPAAADVVATNTLVTGKQVRALIVNAQTEDAVTKNLAGLADANAVPVIRLTETLPQGVTDYLTWQSDNVTQLTDALAKTR